MVHEIHVAVLVAAITVLIPAGLVALSMNPLDSDVKHVNMLQSAKPTESSMSIMSSRQNPMETLEEVYNNQAFAEIARCTGSDSSAQLLCEDTMELLIRTCTDSTIKRIQACDDTRLKAYENTA